MLNVALIGIGNIGLLFDDDIKNRSKALSHIKAIYLNKKLNLKYAVDIDNTHKKKVQKFFPNIIFLNDYTKLVKNTDIDILTIATPTSTHYDILKSFSENKIIKQFFVEKPLFLTKKEYKSIPKKITSKITVNYLRRFDKTIQKLKKNISTQNNIEKIIINYCKGLKNNGSHMIDMINFLFNNPKLLSSKILSSSIGFDKNDLSYDIYINIEYKNKIIPIYLIAHNHTKYNLIEFNIYTDKEFIKYDNAKGTIEYYNIIKHPIFPTYKIFNSSIIKSEKNQGEMSIYKAYNYIIKRIKKKTEVDISSFNDEYSNIKFIYKLLGNK